jgi:LacI family transcriptional regulator
MNDLKEYFCQNKNCAQYGVRDTNNIRVRAYYGKNRAKRLLYCTACKQTFSERMGTVFFNSRLSESTVVSILEHVVEGTGMRKTGRLLHVDPDTVIRYTRLAGAHAEQLHDELVSFSPEHPGGSIRREVGLCAKKEKKLR